jgi:hypothetical protein
MKPPIGRVIVSLVALVIVLGQAARIVAATSDNLEDLAANNGTLSIGDKTFSSFSFQEDGLTSFDPSKIEVTASVNNGTYFLTWDGNMSLTTANGSGSTSADLVLKYTVTATAGEIDALDASFTGSTQPNGGAFIAIDETARDSNGDVVGSTHLDSQNPPSSESDTFPINPPQSQLSVTKDISFGVANGGFATVSEVEQSFHQVPEPSTLSLLTGILVLGGVSILRRRGQN